MTIGCILLASGTSSRFKENKLLAEFEGKTLFETTLCTIPLDLQRHTVVVTAYHKVKEMAEEKGFLSVWNDAPEQGISRTIKLGLEVLKNVEGYMFCVCDQPLRRKENLVALMECFKANKTSIVALSYEGVRGNPVIFPKDLFSELCLLEGDTGGNEVIKNHLERLILCPTTERMDLYDVDTSDDLKQLHKSC